MVQCVVRHPHIFEKVSYKREFFVMALKFSVYDQNDRMKDAKIQLRAICIFICFQYTVFHKIKKIIDFMIQYDYKYVVSNRSKRMGVTTNIYNFSENNDFSLYRVVRK